MIQGISKFSRFTAKGCEEISCLQVCGAYRSHGCRSDIFD